MNNLCSGQEATVSTEHRETEWFPIDKCVRQSFYFISLSLQFVSRIYHKENWINFRWRNETWWKEH